MTLIRKFNKFSLIFLLLFAAPESARSEEWLFDDVDRVVAIADIHGAYDAMVTTLQKVDIIGDDLNWTGGRSFLVIVGDILDRGPKSRAAMDLLMRIEGEAELAGGRVIVLIGNHESMLLTGDMRYVSAPEYKAFADEEDFGERARWFDLYVEREDGDAEELQASFDKNYPPGYFAMRRAFRADGHYGQWLLQKNIIAVINGTAFVHGGLPPLVAKIGLEGINADLRSELAEYVEALGTLTDAEILLPTDSHYAYEELLSDSLLLLTVNPEIRRVIKSAVRLEKSALISTAGPLWYRNNILCPAIVEEYRLEAALAAIGAKRVVVGHTPTPQRQVQQRFDGLVIQIDTGMLNFYYKGIGHALVLEGDTLSVTDQSGVDSILPQQQPRDVGRRPGKMTTLELQTLLAQGEIVSVENVVPGILKSRARTIVGVSNGEHTVSAIFSKRRGKDKDSYPGVAAYRLDELLQLEMVPVTVKREVNGDSGSLQFFPENTVDETQRSASGKGGSAWCSITDQWPAMYVFDVLVYNQGRTQQRMMYDKSSWRLILSEHDRTFASKKGRPEHLRRAKLPVSAGWKAALSDLTDEVLQENLGDVLDKRQLSSLGKRRDQLLATP